VLSELATLRGCLKLGISVQPISEREKIGGAPVNCSVLIPQPLQEGAVKATKTLARGRLLLPLPAQSSPAVDEQILDGFSKVHVFFIFPLGQFIFFFFFFA